MIQWTTSKLVCQGENLDKKDKLLNTNEAKALVKKKIGVVLTRPTIIAWIRDAGLGYKLGGRWWVAPEKLIAYLEGKK